MRDSLKDISPQSGSLPFCSTVTGAVCDCTALDADYWTRNVIEPVNFVGAVEYLLQEGVSSFVEISPHSILSSSVLQIAFRNNKQVVAIPSINKRIGERRTLLQSVGSLYANGHTIHWNKIYQHT